MISIPRNNCALDVARSATRKSPVLPYFAPVSDANPLLLAGSSPVIVSADLSEWKIVREPFPNTSRYIWESGRFLDACEKKEICLNFAVRIRNRKMTRFQEMCNSSSNQHEDKEEFFHLSFWKIIRVRLSPIHHRQASSVEHQHDPKNTRTSPRKIFLKKEKKEHQQLRSWLSPWLDADPSTNRAGHKSFPPYEAKRHQKWKYQASKARGIAIGRSPRSKNNLKVDAREYPRGRGGDPGNIVLGRGGGLTRRGY